MPLRQYFGRRRQPSLWPPTIGIALFALVWVIVFETSIRRDLSKDHAKFVTDDNAQRRRDAAERCISGRVDQIVRVSMPIATPAPNRSTTKRLPKHYTPTTVTQDCDDAKRERIETR